MESVYMQKTSSVPLFFTMLRGMVLKKWPRLLLNMASLETSQTTTALLQLNKLGELGIMNWVTFYLTNQMNLILKTQLKDIILTCWYIMKTLKA